MQMHALRRSATLAFLLLPAACAGVARAASADPSSESQDSRVVLRAELAPHDEVTAYEALRRLRPLWLRKRGTSVLVEREREAVRVYLDGVAYGDVTSLQSLHARDIEEMRFLDSREATTRFGTGHIVGAIAVTTRH